MKKETKKFILCSALTIVLIKCISTLYKNIIKHRYKNIIDNTNDSIPYAMEEMTQIKGSWKYNSVDKPTYFFGEIPNFSNRYLKGICYDESSSTTSKPIVYNINSKYKKFTCVLSNDTNKYTNCRYIILIYGDGRLLYESPSSILPESKIPLNLNVDGINNLKFLAKKTDNELLYKGSTYDYVVILNPTLWK